MSFLIRPAIEEDIPFILKGYQYVTRDNPMQSASQLTAEKIKNDVLVADPKAYIDVALFEDEVMAFVIYSTVYFASTGQNIWVTTMYVDPFAPRPGLSSVGKRLVEYIGARFPDVTGIYATTERNNKSMQFLTDYYGGKILENLLFIGGPVSR